MPDFLGGATFHDQRNETDLFHEVASTRDGSRRRVIPGICVRPDGILHGGDDLRVASLVGCRQSAEFRHRTRLLIQVCRTVNVHRERSALVADHRVAQATLPVATGRRALLTDRAPVAMCDLLQPIAAGGLRQAKPPVAAMESDCVCVRRGATWWHSSTITCRSQSQLLDVLLGTSCQGGQHGDVDNSGVSFAHHRTDRL